VDSAVIWDHAAMAETAFHHFEGLLGPSVDREFSLDLDFLGLGTKDLSNLKREISDAEI
jgi:hypothetical protein